MACRDTNSALPTESEESWEDSDRLSVNGRFDLRNKVSKKPKLDLSTVRVLQRKLVYIIGLAPSIAEEEVLLTQVLKTSEFLGQYGAVKKCVVNKGNAYKHGPGGLSYSAYVTFVDEIASARCIKAMDGFIYESRELKASYGTTKYCSYFLSNTKCPKADCLYLHQRGTDEDTFSKEDMLHQKHIRPTNSLLETARFLIVSPDGVSTQLPSVRIVNPELPAPVQIPSKDNSPSPVKTRMRSDSRYDFVQEETGEQAPEVPEYIQDIVQTCSPAQRIAAIPSSKSYTEHIDPMLSPTSPDKWMSDVFSTRRRALSEAPMLWEPRKLFFTETELERTPGDFVIVSSKI